MMHENDFLIKILGQNGYANGWNTTQHVSFSWWFQETSLTIIKIMLKILLKKGCCSYAHAFLI